MKYKIGDKVLVRSDLKEGKKYGDEVVMSDMLYFKGKIVTIEHIDHPNCYQIKEDPDQWYWTDEMFFEKVSEDFIPKELVLQNIIPEEEKSSDIITVKITKLKLLL